MNIKTSKSTKQRRAKFKFNNGLLALLCTSCSKIIKVGSEFTEDERKACSVKKYLKPQYCEECKLKY